MIKSLQECHDSPAFKVTIVLDTIMATTFSVKGENVAASEEET
jgi:hypothetical protein